MMNWSKKNANKQSVLFSNNKKTCALHVQVIKMYWTSRYVNIYL